MQRVIVILLVFVAGLFGGWYLVLRDSFHMADKEMAEAGVQIRDHMPEFMERMKRSDDMTAALALGTFKRLEQGNVDGAKKLLLPWIGGYYRRYHAKGGDQKI